MKQETPVAHDDEFNLIDIFIVLARHKKKFLVSTLAAAVIGAGVSYIVPEVFAANTRLLPPQQAQSTASAMLAQLGGAASLAAGVAGIKNPNDVYIGMLKSRTIADRLIDRFKLSSAYGVTSQDATRQILAERTTIASSKEGLISIEVEDLDRTRVAALTNAYVEELKDLTKKVAVTEAARRRLFFEQQLALTKDRLNKAESTLKQALGKNGVMSVDAESAAIVETGARLRAQISAKEIQLDSMKAFVTESNPEYRRAAEELSSLRSELFKLQNGSGGEQSDETAPRGGVDSVKLLREVKYKQTLYELLAKQYEVARLDEAKDADIVQVLDPAVTPERRARPKRALMVLMSSLFAFFACAVFVFAIELKHKIRTSSRFAGKWLELVSNLRLR